MSTRLPSTSINATPSRGTPATVVVAVGDAVTVPSADATHVRVFGVGATHSAADVVCLASTRPSSSTLLARRPGYVRVVVSSAGIQRLLYLKITS